MMSKSPTNARSMFLILQESFCMVQVNSNVICTAVDVMETSDASKDNAALGLNS